MKEKTVVRPKDSLLGLDVKECPVLDRTKEGDRLHPAAGVLTVTFPISNEKWTAEDIPEPPEPKIIILMPTLTMRGVDDSFSDDDNNEAEDDVKILEMPKKKERRSRELPQDPTDGVEPMDTEPTNCQKSARS